jgi:serine phosphatase RsbU (regulator of sigma subunit)
MSPFGAATSSAAGAVHTHRLADLDSPPAGAAGPAQVAPMSPAQFAPELIERQVESVAREVEALRDELDAMRRRDDALNTYLRKMDEELRLAARLQQDFLPKSMPQVGRVRFHTLFRPAGYVSGDLYDVSRLDEKRVGFYMADAVGHGVPAALLTMFIKHALQTKEIDPRGKGYRLLEPGETLRRLNERLIDQNLSHSTFATALYGTVDVETLQVTVARAGHPHPVILRADGTTETLRVEGSLLGIFPEETYGNYTTRLHPGDRLIVYTDGLDVAFAERPEDGADAEPRWREELHRRRALPAVELLAQFAEALDSEAGSLRPKDDITLVLVDALA